MVVREHARHHIRVLNLALGRIPESEATITKMVVNTTTQARASSTGSTGNLYPVRGVFYLLDLLEQVKNVYAALGEFKEDHDCVAGYVGGWMGGWWLDG